MKRFHVHLRTQDLAAAERFYSALLGTPPTVVQSDYLKWVVDDPRLNLAVSTGEVVGTAVDHLGLQAESPQELDELASRLARAQISAVAQEGADCCYAKADKHWTRDPEGVVWETFHTLASRPTYGDQGVPSAVSSAPCCDSATS
ncbi:MAG: ArsI/CadI family heavy metal resistance metalloenzyme [Pseudomonadota bacterium]